MTINIFSKVVLLGFILSVFTLGASLSIPVYLIFIFSLVGGICILHYLPLAVFNYIFKSHRAYTARNEGDSWSVFYAANSLSEQLANEARQVISATTGLSIGNLSPEDALEDVCVGDGCDGIAWLEALETKLFINCGNAASKSKQTIQIRTVGDYVCQWCILHQ